MSDGPADDDEAGPSSTTSRFEIDIVYIPQPLAIGTPYYYKVQRITADRQTSQGTTSTTNTNTTSTTTTSTTTTSTTTTSTGTSTLILPVLSQASGSVGSYTPLYQPLVETPTSVTNLNLTLTIDLNSFRFIDNTGDTPVISTIPNYDISNQNIAAGVTYYRVQIARTQSFNSSSTVISEKLFPPQGTGSIVLQAGSFNIPSVNVNGVDDDYDPGVDQLFLRVLAFHDGDSEQGLTRVKRSPLVTFRETSNTLTAARTSSVNSQSRFVARRNATLNLNRSTSNARSSSSSNTYRVGVGKPR